MNVQVEISKAEVKGISHFDLQCQMETKTEGTITKSSMINPNRAKAHRVWPKFTFQLKQICSSTVFLFNVLESDSSELESPTEPPSERTPKSIAKCIFPFTFSSSNSKGLKHLAMESSLKQVQLAYLTSEVEGSDVRKAAGKIWFKIVSLKSIPRLKSKVSWMELNAIQDQLAEPKKSPLPSLLELLEKENKLSTSDTFPSDSPKISIVFHSVNTYIEAPKFTPVATIKTEAITQEKSLFDDTGGNNRLFSHSILKPVCLVSESTDCYLQLYLANGDSIIFSTAYPVQMLLPFKHYNWEYNWRCMAGSSLLSPLHHASSAEEPAMFTSVILKSSASQYSKFEGLEFLVYGIDLDSLLGDEDVILMVRFTDLQSKKRSQAADSTFKTKLRDAPFIESLSASNTSPDEEVEYDTSIFVVKYGDTGEITPAYSFYPLHPFFRSKSKGVSLTMQLHASSAKPKSEPWWQGSKVASAEIEIPSSMSSVLSSPENRHGVYWELTRSKIAQSESGGVAARIYGVMRWKTTQMNFLNSDIKTQMHSLPHFKDLVVQQVQPGLITSILPQELREELERDSSSPASATDYKAAVKKMGRDILQLREQNRVLRRDNQRLEEHLMQLESSVILSSSKQAALFSFTKADLIHKIMEQSQRLSVEIEARKASQVKVNTLQKSLIEKNETEGKLMQIQEAHSAQQKLVRNLQLKCEKYRRCADICTKQEEVIAQLDSLLEQQAQDGKVKDGIAFLSKENARLRKNLRQSRGMASSPHSNQNQEAIIRALRVDNAKLRTKCEDLESQLEETRQLQSRGLSKWTKVFEADQRVKIAAAKEKTLVCELEENAKIWAHQKAQCEMQLAEYRAKIQTLEEELARHCARSSPSHRRVVQQQPRTAGQSNPWQPHSLMSVSRQLHHFSPHSTDSESLDPRLSF